MTKTTEDWNAKAREVVEQFEFGDVESMSLDELTDMSLANQAKIAQALRDAKAEEREACARVAERMNVVDDNAGEYGTGIKMSCEAIAQAIRNRAIEEQDHD